MTANRVDQASLNGALTNHERRIRVLEAVPPVTKAQGLPPWFDWDPIIQLDPSWAGGTAPAAAVDFARIMVQTEDGGLEYLGSTPLGDGTMLGEIRLVLTDGGTVNYPYFGVPELLVLTHSDGTYFPYPGYGSGIYHTIGSGWIMQGSTGTYFNVQLTRNGQLLVTNVPDFADLSGAAGGTSPNICRLANTNVSPVIPAFPWVWAAGDVITLSYQSSMLGD